MSVMGFKLMSDRHSSIQSQTRNTFAPRFRDFLLTRSTPNETTQYVISPRNRRWILWIEYLPFNYIDWFKI